MAQRRNLPRMFSIAYSTDIMELTQSRRQSKYSDIRNIPQRSTSNDTPSKPAVTKTEEAPVAAQPLNLAAPSADQASQAASKSTIDINANPIYPEAGKPITQVNIDEGQ